MLFKNVPREVLNAAVETVASQSCSSLHWENFQKQGKNFRAVLRCKSDEKHAREAASGRRTTSANWHIHFWVMAFIFDACPDAVIITSLATYNGQADFEQKAPETKYHQVSAGGGYTRNFGEL